MLNVIVGGSGSGKSEYAEKLLLQQADSEAAIYYLATMQVFGEEEAQKVKRHQLLRLGKGFITIERQVDISEIVKSDIDLNACNYILLECMTNLVANEIFREKPSENVSRKILNEVDIILNTGANLFIVTGNVFEDGSEYDEETLGYMRILAEINAGLIKRADAAFELVAGIPLPINQRG